MYYGFSALIRLVWKFLYPSSNISSIERIIVSNGLWSNYL